MKLSSKNKGIEVKKVLTVLTIQTSENIEDLRILAQQTKNQVYFWKALDEWFVMNKARAGAGLPHLPMPQWCVDQLSIISRRLRDLSEGLDYRVTPEPFGELPATLASVERTRSCKRTLSPTGATKLVLHALELKRSGWNAFERARKLDQQNEDALSIEGFKQIALLSENEAVDALLDEYAEQASRDDRVNAEITDPRSIRKRIAASRKARTPKPP